jgi:amino acid adenylation domain-containing protein
MNPSSLSRVDADLRSQTDRIAEPNAISLLEQEQIARWNDTTKPYPSCRLHELFEDQVRKNPAAIAIEHGPTKLTYAELNARSNRLARYLQSLGIGPSIPVAIGLQPSTEFAVSLLATLKAGGACVPLDPSYPSQRLQLMLADVKAPVFLTQNGLFGEVAPTGTKTIFLDSLFAVLRGDANGENLTEPPSTNSAAYIIYTSGSTGTPKGVVLGHHGLVNHSHASLGLYGLTNLDRVLQFSSISFDIAIEEIFPTWAAGGVLVFKPSNFSLGFAEFTDFVNREEITVLDLPTAYWHEWTNFLHENSRTALPGKLRLVIVGGEKVTASGLARWQEKVGTTVRWINTYGPSEASVIATAFKPDVAAPAPPVVPIGRPIANTRVYLLSSQVDERSGKTEFKSVPIGAPGELFIGGDGVALGYLDRPGLSAEKFVSDPFSPDPTARMYRTGDMARYQEDGQLEFLGRKDDQVKIRGFRVEPGEIEDVLARHGDVAEAAIVTQEDMQGDKRLAAYIVLAHGSNLNSEALRSYLRQRVPDYMVPSSILILDAMPKTPNGKIDRRALINLRQSGASTLASCEQDLQAKILQIWQDLLGRTVSATDNFFELGGHSLLAARMMHRVGQLVHRSLPLAILLQAPTVEELAAAIEDGSLTTFWSSVVPMQPKGNESPFFCIHGVGGNIVGFRDLSRHMAPDHPFYGLQARGLDGAYPCLTSVEAMANQYLSDIRTIQASGPYFLGGYSFGGLVAYEMARQLTARGEQVAFLALFDTAPGHIKPATASLLKSLGRPTPKFLFFDLPRGVYKGVRRRVRALRVPHTLKKVFFANTRAAEKYALQPYQGKITLFRAAQKSLRSVENPYAAWHDFAQGGLEFQDIPGDHYGVLVEPQVQVLAERLKTCLEAAAVAANYAVADNL